MDGELINKAMQQYESESSRESRTPGRCLFVDSTHDTSNRGLFLARSSVPANVPFGIDSYQSEHDRCRDPILKWFPSDCVCPCSNLRSVRRCQMLL